MWPHLSCLEGESRVLNLEDGPHPHKMPTGVSGMYDLGKPLHLPSPQLLLRKIELKHF